MSLTTDYINYLANEATVTALVPAARMFNTTVPQGTALPAIVVQKLSDTPEHHQGGATTLAEARLQVVCLSDSPSEAASVADAIRLRTDGYRGTWNETAIVKAKLESRTDGFVSPDAGGDVGTPDVSMDFLVWYRTTVPDYS